MFHYKIENRMCFWYLYQISIESKVMWKHALGCVLQQDKQNNFKNLCDFALYLSTVFLKWFVND